MPLNGAETLFEHIREGFERGPATGTVQVISKQPRFDFLLHVGELSVSYASGRIASPTSTIVMHDNVIHDLIAKSDIYDSRVVEFSSRLSFSGDRELANSILNLVRRPSATVIAQIARAKQMAASFPTCQVERTHSPNAKIIQAAMAEYRPLLISGMLDEWRVAHWNPKTLETRFGGYQVVSYLPWKVKDYTTNGVPRYTLGVGVPGVLQKYFRAPSALQKAVNTLGFPLLWLGVPGSIGKAVTGLHYDCIHGFLCQVFGTKRVFLYAPDQDTYVYPYRAFNTYRSCWTGPDTVDYERYPLFRQARAIEITLRPGEVLFIPLGWFHCVFALDSVMSISYPVDGNNERAALAVADRG